MLTDDTAFVVAEPVAGAVVVFGIAVYLGRPGNRRLNHSLAMGQQSFQKWIYFLLGGPHPED